MKTDAPRRGAMTQLVAAVMAMVTLAVGPALAADPVIGPWKTVDDKTAKIVSTVELYEQGGKVFAKIIGLTEPADAQGKPKTCTKCTGADKNQPVVGLVIIKDLARSGDRYKGGTILDPADGKVYKAELWLEDGKLKVRGYLGVFYKTQTWLKGS